MEALQRLHNRGSISTGYDIDNSCKFEDANSEGLHKALSSMSRVTFTLSFWIKRTALGAQRIVGAGASGNNEVIIQFKSDNTLEFYSWEGAHAMRYLTNRVFRDTSAWYHLAFLVDTTNGTAGDRVKIYVNGVQETSFSATTVPGQNSQFDFTTNLYVGKGGAAADADFSGYMSEFVYLDGTQAASTDLGEVDSDSGIWKPIDVSELTFGTNGAYLDFKDSANLGNDANGGTDFTETNIAAADQATDTPTNNFATGNPLVYFSNPPMTTFNAISEGATQFKKGANGWETMTSSIAVTSGKWYCEIQNISVPDSAMMGITPTDSELIFRGGRISYHMGASSGDGGVAQYGQNGTLYKEGVGITYSPSPTWVNGTTVQGIALDMDNGKVYFAKDNTWMNNGDPTSGSTGTGAVDIPDYTTKPYVFGYSLYANNHYGRMNFGGYTSGSISSAASDADGYGTFEYAPPSGYYALCTKNLEEYG